MADQRAAHGHADADIARQVERLSDEAFALAKDTARAAGSRDTRHQRATEINGQLRDLQPAIAGLPDSERAGVTRSLTDAQVDVMYVLSDGQAPASLRLNSSGAL